MLTGYDGSLNFEDCSRSCFAPLCTGHDNPGLNIQKDMGQRHGRCSFWFVAKSAALPQCGQCYLFTTTKWSLLFFAQASSLCPVSSGRSFP